MRNTPLVVLIVDDDFALLEATEELLSALGVQVTTANTRAKALEILKKQPHTFSAILADVSMRGMPLPIFLQKARQINNELKIYLMSGHSQPQIETRLQGEKVDGILLKPFRIERLIELFNVS